MRTWSIAAAAAFLALAASCGDGDHHGAPFSAAPAAEVADLLSKPEAHLRQVRRVRGIVTRQCQVTGCWFHFKDAQGRELKIELGATLPKLPPRDGRRAEVEGTLIRFGEGLEFVGTSVRFE
jgi:hypothetical protein